MLMRPSASELIVTSDDSSTIGAGGLGKLKISRTDGLTEGSGTQREMALRKSVAAISTGLGGEEESVTRSVTGPKLPLVSITWCSPATISKFSRQWHGENAEVPAWRTAGRGACNDVDLAAEVRNAQINSGASIAAGQCRGCRERCDALHYLVSHGSST
jgi:hypothetical protein